MLSKIKNGIILILCLFISGNIIAFIGFAKGSDIASILSRPKDAIFWTISEELIMGCTYIPVIIGLSLIILAISQSIVLFIKWINIGNTER